MHACVHACGDDGDSPPARLTTNQPPRIYIHARPRDAPCLSHPGPPSPRSAASPRHRLGFLRQTSAPSIHPAHAITTGVAMVVKVSHIGVPRERATTAPPHMHARPRDAPCSLHSGPPSPRPAASPCHRLCFVRQTSAPSLHPAHAITAAVPVVVKVAGQISVPRE